MKLLKALVIYLLFGLVVALMITFVGGAFHNLLIMQTMGNMVITDLLLLNIYVIFLWLPLCLTVLFSGLSFISNLFVKAFIVFVVVAFLIAILKVIFEKK